MPTAPDPALVRRFNIRIPLRDGVTLAADLVLPADRPAPAVVMRTPYGRGGEPGTERADAFARAGYAAVWVDVRGRGDSDGLFEPYRNDGLDGVDVIAWAAAQDWCDGTVATYGGSYPGRIQWLTALHNPPALRAMIVLVTPADPFVENPTGVPGPMHVHWYRMTDGRVPQYTGAVDWMEVYRHRPLVDLDDAAGFHSALWREECRHQTLDDYREPLRYQHRIAEIDVPAPHISGWYDDEEIGTPANFAAMTKAGRSGQRLLMGPWGHQVNSDRTLGELDFGHDSVVDLYAIMTGFLDEMVREGRPREPVAPVRMFLMGANEWHDLPAWPPPGSAERIWYLDSDGGATSRFGDGRLGDVPPPAGAPADEWLHDPDRPVPFITSASSAQIGGPDDFAGVETRGDVLVFTSQALTEPLDVIGAVRLVAHVSTPAAGHRRHREVARRAPERLRPAAVRRAGPAPLSRRPRAATAGRAWRRSTRSWSRCGTPRSGSQAGHRIRVEIASAAHPKFAVNLGTEGDQTPRDRGRYRAQRALPRRGAAVAAGAHGGPGALIGFRDSTRVCAAR